MGDGNFPESMMTAAQSWRVSQLQEDLFIRGVSFSYEEYLTYNADETKTFVFDGTGCTCSQIIFNPISFTAIAGPVLIDFYAAVTANDDGTSLGISNRRATSDIETGSVLRLNPTGVSLGTAFAGDLVPATETIGQTSQGSSNVPGLPFEIDKTLKYAFTVTNNNGTGTIILVKSTWFEIPG